MFTSVRCYRVKSDQMDELVKRTESGFVNIVSGAPGFVGYYLVDGGDGKLATVSVFETREGAEESTRLAADWVKDNLADLVEGPPDVTAGEVRVSKEA